MIALLPLLSSVAAKAQSGACGVNVSWQLSDGTLTISGEGDMYDNGGSESFSYAIYSDQVRNVVINEGVTSVGDCAFTGFQNLVSVDLPSTMVTIGSESFRNTGLKSIDFPESVTELRWKCFENTALTKVTVPSNIKVIDGGAFENNLSLKDVYWDVDVPFDHMDMVAGGIFAYDPISTITFGSHVRNICPYFMFDVVPGYKIVSNGNIEYVGEWAFEESEWFTDNLDKEVLYFDKCLYKCGNGLNSPTNLVIKEGTLGLTTEAFRGNRFLTGVTIPESMIKMGGYSFYECSSLTKVVWNAVDCSVIDNPGFGNGLSDLSFGDKVIELPANFCINCTGLTSLSFPESLKTIGGFTFSGCSGIESLQFNEHLDSIAEYAFNGCTKIKSLHLTARVIEARAFESLDNIAEITLNNNVKKIDGNFAGTNLATLTLPSSLEKISWSFGGGHIGKVNVECPDAEKVLEDGFWGLPGAVINNIIFAEGVKTCQPFSVVDTVSIPESVVKMNGGEAGTLIYRALAAEESGTIRCNNVTIAEGVQIIPDGFVCGSNITEVVLPASVTEINQHAFESCEELVNVTVLWYDPREINIEEWVNPFYGINEEATLYVPKGRIEAYKSLYPWSEFRYIKEIDGSTEIEEVATPAIAYENGELHFTSTTPDAQYHYTISDPDIVTNETCDGSVWLNAYYEISVYASAPGLINSAVASAKLYFIEANLEEAGAIETTYKRGVLVSTSGNTLTVSGLDNNETIEVYDISGRLVGKGNAKSGSCSLTIDSDQNIVLVHTATETIKVRI